MIAPELAQLEWDFDLPPGFLVDHLAVWQEYGVELSEVAERVGQAKYRAAVTGKPITEILTP